MKKWVRFDKYRGVLIDTIDKSRLKKNALEFKSACLKHSDNNFVKEIYQRYSNYVHSAKSGFIVKPVDDLPSIRDIEDVVNLPKNVRSTLAELKHSLLGRPYIMFAVGIDEFYKNESSYIKCVDGEWFVFELFENDSI